MYPLQALFTSSSRIEIPLRCRNIQGRGQTEKESNMTSIAESRACNYCQVIYPITLEFYQAIPNSSDGFRKTCRLCKSARDAKRYKSNRLAIIERSKAAYWQDPQKKAAYDSKRRQKYKTKIAVTKKEWSQKYKQEQPFRFLATRLNNSFEGLTFRVTERDITRLMNRYNFSCAYCKCSLRDLVRLEFDHVVPRRRGGVNGISNYVPACIDCNREKSYRLVMEWRINKIVPLKALPKSQKRER